MPDAATAAQALTAWLPDRAARIEPLGDGHINDTWLVGHAAGRFVLQRINPAVFPEPLEIARKVSSVVDHLARRGGLTAPALCPTRSGPPWAERADGVWRLWNFVAEARTLATLTRPAQAEAAGRAFGAVQVALADYPDVVPEPIPGFMQLAHYLRALDATPLTAEPEVALALTQIDARRELADAFPAGERLVHGDCKIDNLLFRPDDSVAHVIDLDTVMHGHWAWDFGDLVRSAATSAGAFDVDRFALLARGFVRSGAATATPQALILAPRYVALMLAVRFLTDHCRGDRYFKVRERGDNLRRACDQLAVLQEIERQERGMREAVARV